MSKRSDNLLIRDIQVSVERILKATAMLDQAGFESDVIIQDAVIRNFEVVGEAAKNLSAEIRSKNPDVDWQGMNGFRNFLIHVYFGVDLGILWNIIQHDIPILDRQIKQITNKG